MNFLIYEYPVISYFYFLLHKKKIMFLFPGVQASWGSASFIKLGSFRSGVTGVMYLNRQESAKGVHVPPERYFVIKPIIL
jgi:hypothetical protein